MSPQLWQAVRALSWLLSRPCVDNMLYQRLEAKARLHRLLAELERAG